MTKPQTQAYIVYLAIIAFFRICCKNFVTHHGIFLETPVIFLHTHYSRLVPINLIRINHSDRSYRRSHGNSFTLPYVCACGRLLGPVCVVWARYYCYSTTATRGCGTGSAGSRLETRRCLLGRLWKIGWFFCFVLNASATIEIVSAWNYCLPRWQTMESSAKGNMEGRLEELVSDDKDVFADVETVGGFLLKMRNVWNLL